MAEGPQIPYTNGNHDNTGNQIVDTVEAFAFLGAIWFIVRGMKRHPVAGVLFVLCLIGTIWTLMGADMTSGWADVFWALIVADVIFIGRLIS